MMSDKKIISSKKIDSFSKILTALLFANVSVIFILIAFTLNLKESTTSSLNNSSPSIVQNSNSDSLLGRKVIAWFCAGAFGYGAIYAIGRSISDKK